MEGGSREKIISKNVGELGEGGWHTRETCISFRFILPNL
jgi:hypothetical protein